jgi:hypothetical protein
MIELSSTGLSARGGRPKTELNTELNSVSTNHFFMAGAFHSKTRDPKVVHCSRRACDLPYWLAMELAGQDETPSPRDGAEVVAVLQNPLGT